MTYTPDISKKPALFELFRTQVWLGLTPDSTQEFLDTAYAAKAQGIDDQDLEWLDKADAQTFASYFGAQAIGPDLRNAMKAADAALENGGRGFGRKAVYSSRGYYLSPQP